MVTALIGLGNIGAAIASRLVDRRQPVLGVDTSAQQRGAWRARTDSAVAAGLTEVPWERTDRLLIVVRSSADAMAVLEEVIARAQAPLACHIMTTLDVSDAQSLQRISERAGDLVRVLEQPVSGGAAGALAGTLTVLSAGPSASSDAAFVLDNLASRLIPLGGYGLPTLAKLINNSAAAYHLAVNAWALGLAAEHDLPADTLQQILQISSGGSTVATMLEAMGSDQVELLAKDTRLLTHAVGDLPAIGIGDSEAFVAAVIRAKELLGHQIRY